MPGPVDGFDELYEREYVPMVRLAVAMVDSVDVAEELVQDAFARLHQHWRRVDRPGAYLRRAVVNACQSERRRRAVVRRHARPLTEPVVAPEDRELLDALRALPAKRRAVVVLRYYADLPEAEIAEILGVRVGTVKSTLHRALAQLRLAIDDEVSPR